MLRLVLKYSAVVISCIIITGVEISCLHNKIQKDPYTLYMRLGSEPHTLNPITENDGYATAINNRIFETLIDRHDDTLEIVPELAERWQISADKYRYRFFLRKGILWSDGKELTADDVVYSFKVIKNPRVSCAPLKV